MRSLIKKPFILWAALLCALLNGTAMAVEPALTWLGHAAFKYSTASGKIILIDPWTSNPKAPKNVSFTHVEGILVTHGHSDHVGEAFDLAKKFNAPLVASFELTEIAKKHGVKSVYPLNPSGSVEVAGVRVTAVEAIHSSSYEEAGTLMYAGAPMGFVLQEYGTMTLYHAGDTGIFEDMALIARLYQPQIALLPIGGTYTMKPREAAMATNLLGVRGVVPMHYGTFPALTGSPAELEKEFTAAHATAHIHTLTPGTEVKLKDLQ